MWFGRKAKNRRLGREQVLDVKLRSSQVRAARRRMTAVSLGTIFAAVFGSPMFPPTSARFADAGNGFTLVMFREFATTLQSRFKKASTSPAPIPCEAPVTIAVFCVFATPKLLSVTGLAASCQQIVRASRHRPGARVLTSWSSQRLPSGSLNEADEP